MTGILIVTSISAADNLTVPFMGGYVQPVLVNSIYGFQGLYKTVCDLQTCDLCMYIFCIKKIAFIFKNKILLKGYAVLLSSPKGSNRTLLQFWWG